MSSDSKPDVTSEAPTTEVRSTTTESESSTTEAVSSTPALDYVEGFESVENGYGVKGDVIRQITLSSISNPEWANGKTYRENLEMCFQICRDTLRCGGVQVNIQNLNFLISFLGSV